MTVTQARPLKRYVVVHPYTAAQDDELSLDKGDAIMVAETFPDSWMKGIRLRDMRIGFFPGNFVKPLPVTSTGEIVESKRCQVCKEILTSEMSYGRFLWQLEEAFAEPLKTSGAITPEEYSKIFGNTQALVKLNDDLVGQLRQRMQTWDEETSLMGDIFSKIAPLLKLLEGYALQYPNARQVIEKLRKTNRNFMALCSSAEASTGHTLLSLLMNPIQRAPRYQLLLKELLKNTAHEHKDYEHITGALGQVIKINIAMNENLRRMENEQRIIQISKSFPNDDTKILQAKRQFNIGRNARKAKESSSKEDKFLQKRKRLTSFGVQAGPLSSSPGTPHRSPQTLRMNNRPRQHSEPIAPMDAQMQSPATPKTPTGVASRKAGSVKSGQRSPNTKAHFRFSLSLPMESNPPSANGSDQLGSPASPQGTSPARFSTPDPMETSSTSRLSPRTPASAGNVHSQLIPSPAGISPSASSMSNLSAAGTMSALPLSPSQQAIGSDTLFDTSTQRFFIREGRVFLKGNAGIEKYLFLFTDLLLIATVSSRKTYKLKERAALSQCWVMNGKTFDRSFLSITVMFGTPLQMHNWVFLREEEKNLWLIDMDRFVREQKNAFLCGVVDETELPDEVLRYMTFRPRSLMKPTLPLELELSDKEDAIVIGFEGTNGKWQPALATTDPEDTGVEWWFGAFNERVGWFPVGCIPENDQLSFLSTQASQCTQVPITIAQRMKQLWTSETGKSMPSLGNQRIARFYDATGSFKTMRVQEDASADDLISAYYHHGLLYSGRTWDLMEVSVDGTYARLVSPSDSPASIVDRWGTKYRDLMKFIIKERDEQPRSRLFTSSISP
ncbi:uncharacterized protein LOC135814446 [Sycon ciliatum]|uniref:uncharacterized protein LOC135814446 n=1 Tax=Sycon ciliatum TaxID=27933 RepID=UPI0020A8BCAF|eukprot:scpid36556/ scgid1658/ Intersectin-1; SH3 domain-containing protein 1A; SH3P17